MSAYRDLYRPTIGLSDGEVTCRFCAGDGVAYDVPRRVVQAANAGLRERRRTTDKPGRPYCWKIGRTTAQTRPLARVALQWSAHGHDLFANHPLLELCGTCYGQGVLVPRRGTQ